MSRSGSLLPSTESTGGFTTQTMIVPEAFMKKVRQNKILARHHEVCMPVLFNKTVRRNKLFIQIY